ncbi:ATP synthase subunit b [Waddlia chondrophila 2032/99]|uniref:ATP synthase subunit b n=2 Tax=Waddlia chondrophila TaxID=71667 RepID=D6YWH0_WADCW|nr:F0F1 ATP synthase subunit B [Waddlia chondrophila]ADI38481.1 putative F-type ATP synthase, subunit b [Waddlia chondrophila WSU 86-1044]CCB91563.1 ATP synthase subunit b [Waddlia chondrophila 2032/99]
MNVEVGQIVAQVIAFLIILWVLQRYAWGPLLTILEERQERIRSELSAIDAEKLQVQQLRFSYEDKLKNIDHLAQTRMQEEMEKARQITREIEKEAHQRAQEIINKAHIAAEYETNKVRSELKNDLIDLTIAATESVLKKELDEKHRKELIVKSIEELKL